jgi:hypothetical protein
MRGAVRPFYPGPWVIVDETMKERQIVGVGVERGPLTEAEKRQFLPPEKPLSVKREQMEARQRQAEYIAHAQPKRDGAYTPPRGAKRRKFRRTPYGYALSKLAA